MYTLKDSGIVKEIDCDNNFGYVLNNNTYFVNTDYKVLQNQTNQLFLRCMKMSYNGKLELYYLTDEYRPFSSLLVRMKPDTFITIIVNLFSNIIEVQNNGFLTCQNIDLSWDKIFVDINTLKVKLVYLPISVRMFNSYREVENELRSRLVKLIDEVFPISNERIEQLVLDLSNGLLTLEDVYNKARGSGISQTRERVYDNVEIQRNTNEIMRLVSINKSEPFEILLDKSEMVIGKKAEFADKVITFNKMISRKHCRIVKRNNEFYIADENSVNGTYVNGKRLAPKQLYPIKKGDTICLANSNFQVV